MRNLFINLIIFFVIFSCNAQESSFKIEISSNFQTADGDNLKIFQNGYLGTSTIGVTVLKPRHGNGKSVFEGSIKNVPLYFDLTFGKLVLKNHMIEAGDLYIISQDSLTKKINFSGQGIEKIIIRNALDNMNSSIKGKLHRNNPNYIKNDFELADSIFKSKLKFLKSFKNQISVQAYNMFVMDIVSENISKSYYLTNYVRREKKVPFISNLSDYNSPSELDKLLSEFKSDISMHDSFLLAPNILEKYRLDSCFMLNKEFKIDEVANFINKNYEGVLKEKLLSVLVSVNKKDPEAFLFADSLKNIIKTPLYKELADEISSTFVGEEPPFPLDLIDEQGQFVQLENLKGTVLLLDFWYTGCPGCLFITPYLDEVKKYFAGRRFKVLSINVDADEERWKGSLKSGGYSSEGSLNLNTNGKGSKHPLLEYYKINYYPFLMIIDGFGKVGSQVVDPRLDNGVSLKEEIEGYLKQNTPF